MQSKLQWCRNQRFQNGLKCTVSVSDPSIWTNYFFMNKKQNYCSWWFHLDLHNHIRLTIYYFLLLRSFGTILIPEAQEECLRLILDGLLWWRMSEKGFKAPRPQNCPVCSCSGGRPHTVNRMRWNTSGWLEAATEEECNRVETIPQMLTICRNYKHDLTIT